MDLRRMLQDEFAQRRARNARYSLRAFARDLGTDHSSLSQILRNRRSLSPTMIRRFGAHLGLDPALITEACVEQDAEAILRLVGEPGFRTRSRWIAERTGIPLDAVNAALHRLIYTGDLIMRSADHWQTNRSSHA